MEYLRWILLLAGAGLLAGIFLWGRDRDGRRQSLLDAARSSEATDPAGEDGAAADELTEELEQLNDLLTDAPSARTPAAASVRAPRPSTEQSARGAGRDRPAREKIVALHVVAPTGQQFAGPDLEAVFAERGYEFGDYDIYHSLHDGNTVFSIVNMVKPGWFDPESMHEFSTPGISLFLQLPGPLASNVAFDVLLAEARALAGTLGGALHDAGHSTLTQQTIQHLREEVRAFALARADDDADER